MKRMEVKDLSNALEDLSTKFDQKVTALEARNNEIEEITEELNRLRQAATGTSQETQNAIRDLRDTFLESLNDLTAAIYDIGVEFIPRLSVSEPTALHLFFCWQTDTAIVVVFCSRVTQ